MKIIALAFLVILLLEAISDAVVMFLLGGWALLVLPFMILLQLGFDFVFLLVLGYWHYSSRDSKGNRVIR